MRPVKLIVPRGTILNPEHPAACAARGVMGYRVFDAIMGALAQVVPEHVIAACEGGPTLFSIGGRQNGKPFVLTEVMVGTWGARADARRHRGHLQSGREPLEQSGRADRGRTAAAGHRIQLRRRTPAVPAGVAAGLRSAAPIGCSPISAQCTMRADRRDHPPYGLARRRAGRRVAQRAQSRASRTSASCRPCRWRRSRCARATCFSMSRRVAEASVQPLIVKPELVLEDVREGKVSLRCGASSAMASSSTPLACGSTRRRRAHAASMMREAAE